MNWTFWNLFIGNSSPAAADETVYSEVKPRGVLGNNAVI